MKELRVLVIFALLAFSMIGLAVAEGNGTAVNESGDSDSEIVAINSSDLNETTENKTVVAPAPAARNRTIVMLETKKLPSPATLYCESLGYVSEERTDSAGKEYRVCVFPDGKECEEIGFLVRQCGKDYSRATADDIRRVYVDEVNGKLEGRGCGEGCMLFIGGKSVTVKESGDEQKEIIAGDTNAKTGLDLSAEVVYDKVVLRGHLSNGKWALVKYLPDEVSEKALEKMNAKCDDTGCIVELKEVGKKDNSKLTYEVTASKDSKLFGLFKKKMTVTAQVDAESGDVVSVDKPWWAFLASEKSE